MSRSGPTRGPGAPLPDVTDVPHPDAPEPRSPRGDRGSAARLQGPAASVRAVGGRRVLLQPMCRMAVMLPMTSMLATLTTSPDVGACTICPLPMYIPTWLTGL